MIRRGIACGVLLCFASCQGPQPTRASGRDVRFGIGLSALPNLGVAGSISARVARRPELDWRAELQVHYQFLDDEDFADDGFPAAGDWTQLGVGVLARTNPDARRHWLWRFGLEVFEARGTPNIVDSEGTFVALRLGLGFETDLTPRLSIGPELAVMPAYGGEDDEFRFVPQLTWGLRWHP